LIASAAAPRSRTVSIFALDRTAKQFPTVSRAVYSFDGSRPAFYRWLQRDVPPTRP
jgi:hypothetical protein